MRLSEAEVEFGVTTCLGLLERHGVTQLPGESLRAILRILERDQARINLRDGLGSEHGPRHRLEIALIERELTRRLSWYDNAFLQKKRRQRHCTKPD